MRGILSSNSVILPLADVYSRAVLADSPVAWWKLDETSGTTANDSIGSNDLTHESGALVNQTALQASGKSVFFDGVDDQSSTSTLPVADPPFTLECTYRTPVSMTSGENQANLSLGDDSGAYGVVLKVVENGGVLNMIPEVGGYGETGISATLQFDTTYHIALSISSGFILRLYVNGAEIGNEDITGGYATAEGLFLLMFNGNVDAPGEGWLQNVLVYNTALSAARILAHSQAALNLSEQIAKSIDLRIAGLTAATVMPMFSAQDHVTPSYTRNASVWFKGDLSPISVWNSTDTYKRCGVLVSPRHVIFANHYPIANAATMRFAKKADGTVVTKTLSAQAQIGTTDLRVGYFTTDVGAGIGFAKVMPATWNSYLHNRGVGIPLMVVDQERKALVADVDNMVNADTLFAFEPPTNAQRLTFYEDLVQFDSGCPGFFIIGGELVLLSVWHYTFSGEPIHNYITEINAAMATLGGGYTLTEVDLTGYGV